MTSKENLLQMAKENRESTDEWKDIGKKME